jgi:hypothetical protein
MAEQLDTIEKTLNIRKGEKFNVKGRCKSPYCYDGEDILNCDGDILDGDSVIAIIKSVDLIEKIPKEKIVVPKIIWKQLELWDDRDDSHDVIICKYGSNMILADGLKQHLGGMSGLTDNQLSFFGNHNNLSVNTILKSGQYVKEE